MRRSLLASLLVAIAVASTAGPVPGAAGAAVGSVSAATPSDLEEWRPGVRPAERYAKRHEAYARRLLSSIVPSQRWGVGQARPDGWKLFFKGGWAGATGRVNHQVAFVERYGERVSLAIFTEHSPSHGYGSRSLEGVAERLLVGLPKVEPEP